MDIARFTILATVALGLVLSTSLNAATDRKKASDYTIGDSVQPLVIIGEGWSQTFKGEIEGRSRDSHPNRFTLTVPMRRPDSRVTLLRIGR